MFKKEYTIDNLKVNDSLNEMKYEADGRWSVYENKFNVNYSGILTKLIQEAGRWCEDYASDLFIDWISLEEKLHNRDFEGRTYVFGFRRYGVDHLEYILSRLNNGESEESYRSIWRLDVEVSDDEVTMKLGRVH